jgi:hypothetical protein
LSRSSASSLLAAVLLAAPAAADVRLEVSGAVLSAPPLVEVRVDLTNRGDAPARAVSLEGGLLGRRDRTRLEDDLPPGETRGARLRFAVGSPPPGVHALALHVRYSSDGGPAGPGGESSQRAYLLLALGASPPPAVRIAVADLRLDTSAAVTARLESADGRPHRVRLRLLTPRGLQPFGGEPEVQVPATGASTTALTVLRGGAPRPSRQGVVVLAETVGEDVASASAATAVVEVQPDPAWLPRLRRPLAALAMVLLAAAIYEELRRRRGRTAE